MRQNATNLRESYVTRPGSQSAVESRALSVMQNSTHPYSNGSVGARVKARRLELGLTRRAVDDGRISAAHVQRIEDGTRTASLEALIVLAEQLETTALWLLTGSDTDTCLVCGRAKGAAHGSRRTRKR